MIEIAALSVCPREDFQRLLELAGVFRAPEELDYQSYLARLTDLASQARRDKPAALVCLVRLTLDDMLQRLAAAGLPMTESGMAKVAVDEAARPKTIAGLRIAAKQIGWSAVRTCVDGRSTLEFFGPVEGWSANGTHWLDEDVLRFGWEVGWPDLPTDLLRRFGQFLDRRLPANDEIYQALRRDYARLLKSQI